MVADVNDAGRGPQGGGGKMRCPVCDVPLSMADRQGVEIDFCPDCRGVWLDRGELDKIIERSIGEVAPRASEGNYPSTSQGKPRAGHDDRRSGGHAGLGELQFRERELAELVDRVVLDALVEPAHDGDTLAVRRGSNTP